MGRRLALTILRSAIAATIVLLAVSVRADRRRSSGPLTVKKLDDSDLSPPVLLVVGGMHYRNALAASPLLSLLLLGWSALAWRRQHKAAN
jgi:hypothetical protein